MDLVSPPQFVSGHQFVLEVSGWRANLTVVAAGEAKAVLPLLGPWARSRTGEEAHDDTCSELILDLSGAFPEIHWQRGGVPRDLGLFFTYPEYRFYRREHDGPTVGYSDGFKGEDVTIEACEGRLRLRSADWPLYLESVINWIIVRESSLVVMHAAVCSYRGTAICLLGSSGRGKSTLACALGMAGARYWGDESLFADPRTGRLQVRPRPVALRPGGLAQLGYAAPDVWHEFKLGDPKCTWDLLVDQEPFPAQNAVFYHADGFAAAPGIRELTRSEAVRRLIQGMSHGEAGLQPRLESAAQLADRYPQFALKVGPPAETACLLLDRVAG